MENVFNLFGGISGKVFNYIFVVKIVIYCVVGNNVFTGVKFTGIKKVPVAHDKRKTDTCNVICI